MPPRIVLIAGPTAVGKSSLALGIAERIGGEIVSIDSVQIYRGLDIGSAKPSAAELQRIPHHLVDQLDPDEECNVADFVDRALRAIDDIHVRGRHAVAVGGTNLYLRVLVHGIFDAPPPSPEIRARHRATFDSQGVEALYQQLAEVDPVLADRLHPHDFVRISRGLEVLELTGRPLSEHQAEHAFRTPNVDAFKIALNRPRPELYERIDARVDQMLADGLVEEVRGLLEAGYCSALKPMQSLGYRHVCSYLDDQLPYDDMVELLKRDTRRFAKQQLSWLRSEPGVVWAPAAVSVDEVATDVVAFLDREQPALNWADPTIAHI